MQCTVYYHTTFSSLYISIVHLMQFIQYQITNDSSTEDARYNPSKPCFLVKG